jgi:hypothetical protein
MTYPISTTTAAARPAHRGGEYVLSDSEMII